MQRASPLAVTSLWGRVYTANPRAENLDFQGFDSVRFLILRVGISRSTRNFPEIPTRRFLVCGFSVSGLAVQPSPERTSHSQKVGSPQSPEERARAEERRVWKPLLPRPVMFLVAVQGLSSPLAAREQKLVFPYRFPTLTV